MKAALKDFIQAIRQYSPVGISPSSTNPSIRGAPEDWEGGNYPGAESILQAIRLLKKHTGLIAVDMHHQNAMVRYGTKEIVIMDVGLFKKG